MGEYKGKYIYEGDPHLGDPYRAAYLNSVKAFIEKKKAQSYATRESFMPPCELKRNPEKYREALLGMIGSPTGSDYPTDIPTYEAEYVAADELSEIYRLKIQVLPEFYTYCMLFKPLGVSGKTPLVIAQHGGGSLPEICSDTNGTSVYGHFTKRALERGMTVLVPQLLLWTFNQDVGEKRVPIDLPYNRAELDSQLKELGLSITGLEVFCIRRAIDAISAESYIDSDRIGMMGLSYGGYFTLYTSAIDTRIRSVYAAGFYNDRTHVAFKDWRYSGYLNLFSDCQVAALVAPRRLAVDVGKSDPVFDYSRSQAEAERAREYFKYLGCEDNFRFSYWEGGHRFDDSGEGFEFFFKGLE